MKLCTEGGRAQLERRSANVRNEWKADVTRLPVLWLRVHFTGVGMDAFTAFATEGLLLPAVMIAIGTTMVLGAPFFHTHSKEDVAGHHPAFQYPATRQWARPGGFFAIALGIFIAVLRLST